MRMAVIETILFLCFLFQGSFCQDWDLFLPTTLEGLSGSCLVIPCSYSVPFNWDWYTGYACEGKWKRGNPHGEVVLDSSLTGSRMSQNIMQGTVIGDLHKKNCTTIFESLPNNHDEVYYFRLECNYLLYSFQKGVQIISREMLPRPTLTPTRLVVEGKPMTLTCSAVMSCPTYPPSLTWTPVLGDVVETRETESVTSVMTFNASYLLDRKKVTCSARYRRSPGYSDFQNEQSSTVRVLYAPRQVSVNDVDPVSEGSSVTLTCVSRAHPAADSFTWYKINSEGDVTVEGSEKTLSTNVTEDDRRFFCKAGNKYGAQNSSVLQIGVQFAPKETTVIQDPNGPILEGGSVALLCKSRSNPPVTNYTWFRNDVEEADTGHILKLHDVQPNKSVGFSCKAKNDLGEEISAPIKLDVEYLPKNTVVSTEPTSPVLDGGLVTLICSSDANPPAVGFKWFVSKGGETEVVGSEQTFTLNVTKLSEDQYFCEALNTHGSKTSEPVVIDVQFAAEILPSSQCVQNVSQIQCLCESQGNPLPSLAWELAGEPVNQSSHIQISDRVIGGRTLKSVITFQSAKENVPSLVCLSSNSLGSDSRTFNNPFSETWQGPGPVLIGCVVVLVVMVVSIPLLVYFYRKRTVSFSFGKRGEETSERVDRNIYLSALNARNEAKDASVDEGGQCDIGMYFPKH